MAINSSGSDALAEALGLNPDQINFREKVWIWLSIAYGRGEQIRAHPGAVKHPGDEVGLASFCRENQYVRSFINTQFWDSFLPEQHLTWIKDEPRQTRVLLSFLRRNGSVPLDVAHSVMSVLSGRELIVGLVDWINLSRISKDQLVGTMYVVWNEHLKKDSLYFWFQIQDEPERCALIWDILMKENPGSLLGSPRFSTLKEVLQYFDASDYSFAQIKLFVDRVKKRRSQNLYRQNLEGKKQVNWILSAQAIKQLDKLSEEFRLSRAQILETLIHDESKKKIYLSERQRRFEAFLPTEDST